MLGGGGGELKEDQCRVGRGKSSQSAVHPCRSWRCIVVNFKHPSWVVACAVSPMHRDTA